MTSTFERNLAFFSARDSVIADILRGDLDETIWLEEKPGGLNLRWEKGGVYYSDDPPAEGAARMDQFLAKPLTYYAETDDSCLHDTGADLVRFFEELSSQPGRLAERDLTWPGEAHHFVHYGIAMGYELSRLIEVGNVRHVYAIEPYFEVFRLSARHIDWEEMFQRAAARGIVITLYLGGKETRDLSNWVHHQLSDHLPGAFTNICFFTAYDIPAYEKFVLDCFHTQAYSMRGWGFMEDEMVFIDQSTTNMLSQVAGGYLGWPEAVGTENVTAVVVASGPSLVKSLDALRDIKGKAVIISCGTALRPLLLAGIMPDLHVELERVEATAEGLQSIADEGLPIGEIPLICSLTTAPKMATLFKEVFYFIRANAVVNMMTGDQITALQYCSPYADHAGSAVAMALGCRRIVFVGVDLGTTDLAFHHAPGTVYDSLEAFRLDLETEVQRKLVREYPLEARGNFGGTVMTNDRFTHARIEHERTRNVVRERHGDCIQWFNASHGVLIDGYTPLPDLSPLASGDTRPWLAAAMARMRTTRLVLRRVAEAFASMYAVANSRHLSRRLAEGLAAESAKAPLTPLATLWALEQAYESMLDQDPRLNPLLKGDVNHIVLHYLNERAWRGKEDHAAFDRLFANLLVSHVRTWEGRIAQCIGAALTRLAPPDLPAPGSLPPVRMPSVLWGCSSAPNGV